MRFTSASRKKGDLHMMKRKLLTLATGLSVATLVGPVLAAYNTPSKAKALKVDLAVAYNACTGTPNDKQGTVLPLDACHPPVPTSNNNTTHELSFGPKGAANLTVQVGKGDIKLSLKSADVLDHGTQ